MIQANCRAQLTSNDFQFLVDTLARKSADLASLQTLIGDPSTLDELLDHETVFQAILTCSGCIGISPYLYFYVLARRVLRNAGIGDRAVADYLGGMLAQFSEASRVHVLAARPDQHFEYITDLLAVIGGARQEETFLIRAHIGNFTLFFTGVFPQRLEHRTRFKGAPDLEFYEGVGSQSFRLLSDHHLAYKRKLHEVFDCLGEQFHTIRLGLNDMADRLLHIDKGDCETDRVLAALQGNVA